MSCRRSSRFWGLGCPKIFHEIEDSLEEVVDDEVIVKYRRGVLEVVFPKSSASRRRKIEVKVN